MRLALDTNILVYLEGVNGLSRQKAASEFISKLRSETTFVPVQVLGELFGVLLRKAKYSPERARSTILSFADIFQLLETSPAILKSAADLSVDHGLVIWDAVILATAADAGCRLLLSEDLHEGFTWHGVTVTNPFAAKKHVLLQQLLEE